MHHDDRADAGRYRKHDGQQREDDSFVVGMRRRSAGSVDLARAPCLSIPHASRPRRTTAICKRQRYNTMQSRVDEAGAAPAACSIMKALSGQQMVLAKPPNSVRLVIGPRASLPYMRPSAAKTAS